MVYTNEATSALFTNLDAAEIFITSGAHFETSPPPTDAFHVEEISDVAVVPALAVGEKCERCYQILKDVGSIVTHPKACRRCADAAENYLPLDGE